MSFSFNVTGETKAMALELAKKEMDQVVLAQPVHARDRAEALANAEKAVGLLKDDPARGVAVTMNGSLGWDGVVDGKESITSVSIGVMAYLVNR
jgi:hypothetical protein